MKFHLDKSKITIPVFKDNKPGREWVMSFLKRHKKSLSVRTCQNIKGNRAAVSKQMINAYFDELKKTLDQVPPHLILNYDETAFCDDPRHRKLVFQRGTKYPERVMNSTKSSVSVLFTGTASGVLLPPYVVYKSTNLYDLWTENEPVGCAYNRTKSWWLDGSCFLDWFQKIVIPYCRRYEGKKVIIGDNLATHLSPVVIKLAEENNTAFVFLPPNSTHLTQPLDVAVFRAMKIKWRLVLEAMKNKLATRNQTFDKKYFPYLLRKTMLALQENIAKNLKAGFKKTGIYLLNRTKVLECLPQVTSPNSNTETGTSPSLRDNLRVFESVAFWER